MATGQIEPRSIADPTIFPLRENEEVLHLSQVTEADLNADRWKAMLICSFVGLVALGVSAFIAIVVVRVGVPNSPGDWAGVLFAVLVIGFGFVVSAFCFWTTIRASKREFMIAGFAITEGRIFVSNIDGQIVNQLERFEISSFAYDNVHNCIFVFANDDESFERTLELCDFPDNKGALSVLSQNFNEVEYTQ